MKRKKLITNKILHKIDTLTGRQFEFYTATLFRLLGYQIIKITCASGDFGTDVIVKNKKDVKIGIQCKHINKDTENNIGYNAVEETLGGKNYYQLDNAIVITNGFYSQSAIDGSRRCHVKLLDRNWIVKQLLYLIRQNQANIPKLLNIKNNNINTITKGLPPKTIMTLNQKKFYDSLTKISYPVAILIDHNLTFFDKELLSIILTIVNKTGQFSQSNMTIANEVKTSKQSVSRSIHRLKENKYINYDFFKTSNNIRRYITSINYKKIGKLDNDLRNRITKNLSHFKASIMNL